MRRPLTMPMLTLSVLTLGAALPGTAQANDVAAFEAMAALPTARVMCIGAAHFPEMLRFTFQSEPEGDGRPEVIRTASTRRGARPAVHSPTARAATPVAASIPVLHLPCIQG
jgi:hypothetical protein